MNTDLQIAVKTVPGTGTSQGNGQAMVKSLAAEGIKVIASERNEELLARSLLKIKVSGGLAPVTFAKVFVATNGAERNVTAALAAMGHIGI
ncbi:hypothetical protein [Pseudomonas sp. CFBP 13602]|uniref:hypothetical protein n=1 Tax=Pseudomonas sp. CFBP 13602 TaxID=2774039 RepID=UPI001FD359E8|nr:hypothetical protein [Pseudomonas sp. CFBP 13602]